MTAMITIKLKPVENHSQTNIEVGYMLQQIKAVIKIYGYEIAEVEGAELTLVKVNRKQTEVECHQ